jgi:ribonuclease Z
MSTREFIALGTSSQAPTRERSHNAYLLLWDGEGFLLDPGEGAQRQLIHAGVSSSSINYICITHFHGDHCLGLAGIIQKLSLDNCLHPVHLYYPGSGQEYIDRLCNAAVYQKKIELIFHPIDQLQDQMIELNRNNRRVLMAHWLEHSIPTVGYRLEEMASLRFLPEKLDAAGIHGPKVGELRCKGWIENAGRIVHLEEVTVPHSGSVFAFVMDTRPCSGATALAKDADLLIMEATYTEEHQNLADVYYHSTASNAAETAHRAGACRLAITHFSQRYLNTGQHIIEAQRIFPKVIELNDLDRIEIPRRS